MYFLDLIHTKPGIFENGDFFSVFKKVWVAERSAFESYVRKSEDRT